MMTRWLSVSLLIVLTGCARDSVPTSPQSPNNLIVSTANTGGVGATSDFTGSDSDSTDVPSDSSVVSVGGSLGSNTTYDGYQLPDSYVDWASVLNDANLKRNVFGIGFMTLDNTGELVEFGIIGTGFAAGFSNVLWTNAHVVHALYNNVGEKAFGFTIGFAARAGVLSVENLLSLDSVRFVVHHDYDVTTTSEDVAAFIFENEPFRHEQLPSLLPARFADELTVGQPVGTIGFPGELSALTFTESDIIVTPTFKQGTLSALRTLFTGEQQVGRSLQYNLTTTGGTSGSPVFDHMGYIIGINYAIDIGFVVSDTSGVDHVLNPANAGYAIRVDAMHELIPPVYNSPTRVRRTVDSRPYPYPAYQPFPE